MKTQLIKLQDKFILVSDEEIKQNDYRIMVDKTSQFYGQHEKHLGTHDCNCQWKIIIAGIPELPSIDFSLLSEEDCLKIGYVDVEKLGFNRAVERLWNPKSMETRRVGNEIIEAVKFGFNKSQSLNDKCFSLEDMNKAIEIAQTSAYISVSHFSGTSIKHNFKSSEIIQSLQNVWTVDVERETFWLNERFGGIWQPFPDENAVTSKKQPKIINNSIKIIKLL